MRQSIEFPHVTYIEPSDVIATRQSDPPRPRTDIRVPISWELQLTDKRWRRVYVIGGGIGSHAVRWRGGWLMLEDYPVTYVKPDATPDE